MDYRHLMERLSDRIVAVLKQKGRADLSELSMALAVRVAAQVVGLTESLLPGMDRRLNAFFAGNVSDFGWSPRALVGFARHYTRIALFFQLDVRPAIRASGSFSTEIAITCLVRELTNGSRRLRPNGDTRAK